MTGSAGYERCRCRRLAVLTTALLVVTLLLSQSGMFAGPGFWRAGTAELVQRGALPTQLPGPCELSQTEATGYSFLVAATLFPAAAPLPQRPAAPPAQHPRPGATMFGRQEQLLGPFLPRPPPVSFSA